MCSDKVYIIWDWNGTLLDDTAAALDTLNIMLRKRGNPEITMDFYRDRFSFPVKPFYKEVGVCLENEDWDALAKEYHRIYAGLPKRLNAEAHDVLCAAASRCAGQSILSALRQDLLEGITAVTGVAGFMDFIYGVDNLDGESKMSRGRELVSRIKASGNRRIVLVGDSLHDAEVAAGIGVGCVLCGAGSHAAWRLRQVAATGDTLSEALEIALSI